MSEHRTTEGGEWKKVGPVCPVCGFEIKERFVIRQCPRCTERLRKQGDDPSLPEWRDAEAWDQLEAQA